MALEGLYAAAFGWVLAKDHITAAVALHRQREYLVRHSAEPRRRLS